MYDLTFVLPKSKKCEISERISVKAVRNSKLQSKPRKLDPVNEFTGDLRITLRAAKVHGRFEFCARWTNSLVRNGTRSANMWGIFVPAQKANHERKKCRLSNLTGAMRLKCAQVSEQFQRAKSPLCMLKPGRWHLQTVLIADLTLFLWMFCGQLNEKMCYRENYSKATKDCKRRKRCDRVLVEVEVSNFTFFI